MKEGRMILQVVVLISTISLIASQELLIQPEQIHISYGGAPYEMVISWVTQNKTTSIVEYGKSYLKNITKGSGPTLFRDGGSQHRTLWIHRVTLSKLDTGATYMYHVGSPVGWSDIYYFRAMKSGTNWSPRLAIFGDLGNENSVAMGPLQQEAQRGTVDAVLHVGDFAYDMDTDQARYGDAFMNQIQSIAAYIPYMVCVGNHENAYNFSNYKARFSMPGGDGANLFYSFNIGPAHIIGVSTEVYYFIDKKIYGGWKPMSRQIAWLKRDLEEANKQRDTQPWVIVMGHRPMYCSTHDDLNGHCNNLHNNTVRTGIPSMKIPGLEDIFYQYGVDVYFSAHEHNYERLWPVYNLTVCKGKESPYKNPRAPVHIVTGSGGNEEGQTKFNWIPYDWSAFRTRDYGYTHVTIVNGTHLHLEQISVEKEKKVIDKMDLIKEKHGAGLYDCHQRH